MKKPKKLWMLVAVSVMLASISGCTKDGKVEKGDLSVPESSTASVETVNNDVKMETRYRLEKMDGRYWRLHDVKKIDDSVYIAGNEYFSTAPEDIKEIISVIDLESKEEKIIKEYNSSELFDDLEKKSLKMHICDDVYYTCQTDNEERIVKIDLSTGSVQTVFESAQNGKIEFLYDCDKRKYVCRSGNKIDVFDGDFNNLENLKFDEKFLNFNFCCDQMYNTYVFFYDSASEENVLYKYDADLNEVFNISYADMMGTAYNIFEEINSDNIVIVSREEQNIFINVIDPQTGETLERYEYINDECEIYSLYPGTTEYEMLFRCDNGIYGYNYSTGKKALLYSYDYENIPFGLTNDGAMIMLDSVSASEDATEGVKVVDADGNVIDVISYEKNNDGYISVAYIADDGGIYYIEEEYNPAYLEDNAGGHIVHHIDSQGRHSYFNVSAVNTESYPLFITADSDKNIFIGERNEQDLELVVNIYDISGKLINKLSKTQFRGINTYFMKNDNLYLCLSGKNEEMNLYFLNSDGDKYSLVKENFGGSIVCTSDNDDEIFLILSQGISKYSFETEEFTKIIDLAETGEISSVTGEIGNISYIGNDEFIISIRTEEDGLSCYKLEKYQTQAIQTITIGAGYFDEALMNRIIEFNNENEDCRIVTKSYSGVELINQMHLDLIENKLDIIISDMDLCVDDYSSDMFCDLSEFFENDKDIVKSDYYENIIELYKEEGIMRKISPSFDISVLVARAEDFKPNEKNGWSEEEFLDFATGHNVIGSMNYVYFMRTLIPYLSDNYIDRQNNTCDFVNSQFKNIISVMKDEIEGVGNGFSDKYSLVDKSTDLIVEKVDEHLSSYDFCNDTDIVFKGYPLKDKNGFIVNPDRSFSITSNCKNKEKAWEFIKYFLLDEYQSGIKDSIPLNKKYIFGGVDISLLSENGGVSNETLNKIIEVIENADILNRTNMGSRIYQILEEELLAYFNDQIELDVMAESVQSKITLYLNEIK